MQTFLPYPDFQDSAEVLDKKRCWKQVVEAHQIIDVLEGKSVAWKNHPAVKMWEGHTDCLKAYFDIFLEVAVNNHNINTKYEFYEPSLTSPTISDPWWLGDKAFHRAMRARLIEKDKDFYLDKFAADKGYNSGKYWWPVMDGSKTFKII